MPGKCEQCIHRCAHCEHTDDLGNILKGVTVASSGTKETRDKGICHFRRSFTVYIPLDHALFFALGNVSNVREKLQEIAPQHESCLFLDGEVMGDSNFLLNACLHFL